MNPRDAWRATHGLLRRVRTRGYSSAGCEITAHDAWQGVADPLHIHHGMVVPLLLLGTFAKLAIAATVAHRTRMWWLPGATAIAVGAGSVAVLHSDTLRAAGAGSIILGTLALVIGAALRRA